MHAQIDVRRQDGKTAAEAPRGAPVAQTSVFDGLERGAEAQVQRVIAANDGRGRPAAPPPAAAPRGTASAAH